VVDRVAELAELEVRARPREEERHGLRLLLERAARHLDDAVPLAARDRELDEVERRRELGARARRGRVGRLARVGALLRVLGLAGLDLLEELARRFLLGPLDDFLEDGLGLLEAAELVEDPAELLAQLPAVGRELDGPLVRFDRRLGVLLDEVEELGVARGGVRRARREQDALLERLGGVV